MNGIPDQFVGMALANFPYPDNPVDSSNFGFQSIKSEEILKNHPAAIAKDLSQQDSAGAGDIHEIGQNRIEALVNPDTRQIVLAFQGSDAAYWDFDLLDHGAAKYQKIRDKAQIIYEALKQNPDFQNYKISTTGHSLGGGMAQTFALKNGLDAQVYNSLPIAIHRLEPGYFGSDGIEDALARYKAAGHTVSDVRTSDDIATFYYDKVLGGTYLAAYLGQPPTVLPGAEISPAVQNMLQAGIPPAGLALLGLASISGPLFETATDPRIPALVRDVFEAINTSLVVEVEPGDNAFTIDRADGHAQWVSVDPQSGQVAVQYATAHGYIQLRLEPDLHGGVKIEQLDINFTLLSTAVRMPEEDGGYAEMIWHANGRVVNQRRDAHGKAMDSDDPALEPLSGRAPEPSSSPVFETEIHDEMPATPAPHSPAPLEPIITHEARVTPWPGGMSFYEAHKRRDEPEDTPASSLRPVGRPAVPDRLHELQLLRDLELALKLDAQERQQEALEREREREQSDLEP